jgi:hypothetical protein
MYRYQKNPYYYRYRNKICTYCTGNIYRYTESLPHKPVDGVPDVFRQLVQLDVLGGSSIDTPLNQEGAETNL